MTAWIAKKGTVEGDKGDFRFIDGRLGQLSVATSLVDSSQLVEYSLHEPTSTGLIQTELKIGLHDKTVQVYAELRAEGAPNHVGPQNLDIRCPTVVRTILDAGGRWYLGHTPLTTKALTFVGSGGGANLQNVIWHEERNLPVVCISEDEDGALTIDLAEKVARDLSGLALVARIDSEASWSITSDRGVDWSCFNGAIRIYWPRIAASPNHLMHPLWTKFSLLNKSDSPTHAAEKIRRQLRRRILGLSAFSISEPVELRQIRTRARSIEGERQRKQLQEDAEWEKLAIQFSDENDMLKRQIEEHESELQDLRAQLASTLEALQWKATTDAEVEPQKEAPPSTVQEAVDRARRDFSETIAFGSDVDASVLISPASSPLEPPVEAGR